MKLRQVSDNATLQTCSLVKKDAHMLDAFGKGASDDIRAAKEELYNQVPFPNNWHCNFQQHTNAAAHIMPVCKAETGSRNAHCVTARGMLCLDMTLHSKKLQCQQIKVRTTQQSLLSAMQMTWDAAAGSSARSRPMGGTPLPSPPPSPAPQPPQPAVEHSNEEGEQQPL